MISDDRLAELIVSMQGNVRIGSVADHVGDALMELRDRRRAALATPQAGEYPNLEALADGRIELGARLGDYVALRSEAARLLRATQSNGHSPSPQGNQVQSSDAEVTPSRTKTVAGESPAPEPVAWMMPLGERGLIEWGHKRPDTGDLDKWRPLYSHSHECSDDFTGEIATPSKESLLEDLRLLSNLERAHKMESNSLFIENGQLRKSLKDVLRMLEAAHRQSGIHGTDNKRIVAARSVLNAPPSLYAAPQPDEAREKLRHIAREEECTCTDSSEDCRYCIAARALNECADIERDALAYLARTGGKEET